PLMTIQGYAEGIRDDVFTLEDKEKGLNVITSEVNRLKVLINEMTLLAKLDSEKNVAEQDEINLHELLDKVLDRVYPYALEQDVKVEYIHHDSVTLIGDEDKLLRAFLNIIMNGVRYAESRVEIKVVDSIDKVSVFISDDGS